jgi:hypothetical protein
MTTLICEPNICEVIPFPGDQLMVTPHKQQSAGWFQSEILQRISEVNLKVTSIELQGRDNGEAIRNLRTELGVDGAHGRLPQLEQTIARLDRQQEDDNKKVVERFVKLEDCIDAIKQDEHEARGGKRVLTAIVSFLGGSLGAALVGIAAKVLGLIH